MSDDLRDELGTSSGLIEACTGTVAEAWFGRNEQAEGEFADKMFLFLKLINLESEEGYDEWTARLTIGNGWEPRNGGAQIVREDSSDKKVNNSSDYGRFLSRVLGEDGGKEGMKFAEAFAGAADAVAVNVKKIQDKDLPAAQYADIWVGLRFQFEQEEYSSTIKGETVEWSRLMPVAFVGVDDRVNGGGPSASAASSATTPAPSTNGEVEELYELARKHDSHGEFVKAALPKVAGNRELLAQVADDSDNGIYAKARA